MKKDYLTATLFAILVVGVLDAIWLGIIQRSSWEKQIVSMSGSGMSKKNAFSYRSWAVVLSYLLLIVGIVVFGVRNVGQNSETWTTTQVWEALVWGGILGLVIYGIYNFTNLAIFSSYTLCTGFSDLCWGVILCAVSVLVASWTAAKLQICEKTSI